MEHLYERAVFGGDAAALDEADRRLDAMEADLCVKRGRVAHARFLAGEGESPDELPLFERAVELYRRLGDMRGQGEARFWIGCFQQVVRGETGSEELTRSLELARRAGDELTASYALRHLGIAEHRAGNLPRARELLEESVRLRRSLGFLPGVAANLVGLAYITAAEGGDPAEILDEATDLASASGSGAITRQIEEARSHLRR
ncbi:hypothetical protein ACIBHX_43775 [Nonomuraea sp. NPDC050536]|uniref:hypothetical protein n=1 Tax=Nonomuraea sp. NPDC050536 TaxID=3364366 RepID=UPI0037C72D2B